MEVGQLEFIIAWVSILVTVLGTVLGAFGFLYREIRRKFDRQDQKFDRQDQKIDALQVGVARIEGYLGIGFPAPGQRPADTEPPERAA